MKTRRGFGLIELLLVVVIIGMLSAMLFPRMLGGGGGKGSSEAGGKPAPTPTQRAKQVEAVAYEQQINQAIEMYRMNNDNQFPPNLQALKPYGVLDQMILDPNTGQPIPYDPRTGRVGGGPENPALPQVPNF